MTDKLYLPIKVTNDNRECMIDKRGKVKSYKSTTTLLQYSPNCDEIATYVLVDIKSKEEIKIKEKINFEELDKI